MEENIQVNQEPQNVTTNEQAGGNLPTKVSVWTRLKDFLLQDASQPIEWTPAQQKFVDFWCQEIDLSKVHNFLFKEISFKKSN